MRDLNLGPDAKRLVEQYRKARQAEDVTLSDITLFATQMAAMLERWMEAGWCWHDASPAWICGGPHVRVKYQHDRMGQEPRPTEVIETADKVGETFPDVPYTIIRS